MGKAKKIIANIVMTLLLVASVPIGIFAETSANIPQDEAPDIFAENMVETVEIEGVNFKYEYFKDNNGNDVTQITNLQTNESNELRLSDDIIYLDGNQVGKIEDSKEIPEQSEIKQVRTNWILMGKPVHKKISWLAGTSAGVVLGAIASSLKIPSVFVKSCLSGGLAALASSTVGGTLHYSNYYRNLALGQVQYKTDWSFVASNGKRFGTYTYMSTPS